jgi:hypothetical protein
MTSFLDTAAEFILHIVRAALYLLIALPLMLIDVIGVANETLVGIRDTYPGEPIFHAVPPGAPPPIEYSGYICFDIERLAPVFDPDAKKPGFIGGDIFHMDYMVWYTISPFKNFLPCPVTTFTDNLRPFIHDWNATHHFTIPARFPGYLMEGGRTGQGRKAHVPKAFYNGDNSKRINNYIENYARIAYPSGSAMPGILNFDGSISYPEQYTLEGETYYWLPGDDLSKRGRHLTPREAVDDYTRRMFYRRTPFIEILPHAHWKLVSLNGFEHHLGPGISLITQEQAQIRATRVKYYIWGAMGPAIRDDGKHYNAPNKANYDWAINAGYSDFQYYPGTPMFVNVKYWVLHEIPHVNYHMFSLQFYYSVKPLWRAFIDNSPLFIADFDQAKNSRERYAPEIQALMLQNGIQPGSEQMYEMIADYVNEGRDMSPIRQDLESYNVMEIFFTNIVITRIFWAVTMIALALCLGFSIFAVMRSMGDSELKRPIGKVLGSTGKAMLIFLTVPAILITVLNLSSVVLKQTSDTLNAAIAGGQGGIGNENLTLGAAILSASLTEDSVVAGVDDNKAALLQERRAMLLNGDINWRDVGVFLENFDPFRMFFIPAMVTGWFCVVIMCMIILMFSRRLFEILVLYVAAPFCVATMPLDDGEKFKSWRDMFVSRVLMGFFSLVSLKIFMLILPLIWVSGIRFSPSDFYDSILKLIFMAAGMYAAYKSHTLLTSLLSADAAEADKESSRSFGGKTFNKAAQSVKRMVNYAKQERRQFRQAYQATKPKRDKADEKLTKSFGGDIKKPLKRKDYQYLAKREENLKKRQEALKKLKEEAKLIKGVN